MGKKALGAEITEFYENHWPGVDWYHDYYDDSLPRNTDGEIALNPFEKYDLERMGDIIWQGEHGKCPLGRDGYGEPFLSQSFESVFLKWKRGRTVTDLAVEVRNEDVEGFKALCKERGWKVT